MFPTTRTARILLAIAALVLVISVALPPVSFRLTDLGMTYDGVSLEIVSDRTVYAASRATVLHIGGCKFVGTAALCSHKELIYDHAHGLRFTARVTTRRPSGT
jgi:hypothetical protein